MSESLDEKFVFDRQLWVPLVPGIHVACTPAVGIYGQGAYREMEEQRARREGFPYFIDEAWAAGGLTDRSYAMSEPTKEELLARIAELEKQVGPRKTGSLEFRVSEKGAVSVYGLGRFPVTLYYEQWDKLLAQIEDLRRFIDANRASLKKKEA